MLPGMIAGRLSPELQSSLPDAVRAALRIEADELLVFVVEGGAVSLLRLDDAERDPFVSNFSAFTEWASEEDSAFDVLATR